MYTCTVCILCAHHVSINISTEIHMFVLFICVDVRLQVYTSVQDTYISYFAHSACVGITGVNSTSHKPKPVNVAKHEVRYDHSRLMLHTRFQQMFGGC